MKASNLQKINQSLILLDDLQDVLSDTQLPYNFEVSIIDEYDKDKIIDNTIEDLLDVVTDALSTLAKKTEKEALENWMQP